MSSEVSEAGGMAGASDELVPRAAVVDDDRDAHPVADRDRRDRADDDDAGLDVLLAASPGHDDELLRDWPQLRAGELPRHATRASPPPLPPWPEPPGSRVGTGWPGPVGVEAPPEDVPTPPTPAHNGATSARAPVPSRDLAPEVLPGQVSPVVPGPAPDATAGAAVPPGAGAGADDPAGREERAASKGRRLDLAAWSLRRLVTVSVALLAIAVLTAYLVSASQSTVYAAQAEVLYGATGSSQEVQLQLATQEVLMSSRGVLAPVASRFDVPLRQLASSHSVDQLSGSQVLRLSVRNSDPDLAVRLAQAIADGYVASVSSGVADTGPEEEQRLRDQITDLSVTAATGRARLQAIAAARAAAGNAPSSQANRQEERDLQVQDTAITQRIDSLQGQLTQLLVQRQTARPARVLTPAYLLDAPVGPKPVRAAAAGAMVGLVLAGGVLALGLRRRSALAQG